MERALSELLATARRAGLRVSPAEALDAVRSLLVMGVSDREDVKRALSCVLAKDRADRAHFSRIFDAYFAASSASHADLYVRLAAGGFSETELSTLRALLEATARATRTDQVWTAVMGGEHSIDRLLDLARARVDLAHAQDPARTGFLAMRLLDAAGVPRAESSLAALRSRLRDALGARGDSLTDALGEELASLRGRAREHIKRAVRPQGVDGSSDHVPFAQLDPDEARSVEREVQRLGERLVGRAMVRARKARRGRLDMRRTLRASLATGGVPMVPVHRSRTPRRAKLVVLCDISDSVRHSARFTLLFVHAVQRLFDDCRSFMFVSDVGEATELFRRETAQRAIELATMGAVVNVADNSHYANALAQFLARFDRALDARTTLLIIGDARVHHFGAGERFLQTISERVSKVIWLHPEPEGAWSSVDCAMARYRPFLDLALPVYDLATLRSAARRISG